MATGVFHTAQAGHRRRRKPGARQLEPLDRFAEALSEHFDEDDVAAGLADAVDPGGSVTLVAGKLGIPTGTAYQMYARICKGLGPQAYDCVSGRARFT